MRSTQEWMEYIEGAMEYASTHGVSSSYSHDSIHGLASPVNSPSTVFEPDAARSPESAGAGGAASGHRNVLRKDTLADGDSVKGRKRFSKRQSKNGLAAVF